MEDLKSLLLYYLVNIENYLQQKSFRSHAQSCEIKEMIKP